MYGFGRQVNNLHFAASVDHGFQEAQPFKVLAQRIYGQHMDNATGSDRYWCAPYTGMDRTGGSSAGLYRATLAAPKQLSPVYASR